MGCFLGYLPNSEKWRWDEMRWDLVLGHFRQFIPTQREIYDFSGFWHWHTAWPCKCSSSCHMPYYSPGVRTNILTLTRTASLQTMCPFSVIYTGWQQLSRVSNEVIATLHGQNFCPSRNKPCASSLSNGPSIHIIPLKFHCVSWMSHNSYAIKYTLNMMKKERKKPLPLNKKRATDIAFRNKNGCKWLSEI